MAQTRCPPLADSALQQGWSSYRSDLLQRAAQSFEQAYRLCPRNLDALAGLGFTRLRQGRMQVAESLFDTILARDSMSADGWEGRARSRLALGDTGAALAAGRTALSLAPTNRDLQGLLDRAVPEWDRAPPAVRQRPAALQVIVRTRGRQFETHSANDWQPFYIQGVNLGVALPGKYPSEFPADSARYAGWLDTLATMNANTLRLYTILPPSFYRALRGWNLSHPESPLWLIHGVWAELPPGHDFDQPMWKGEFEAEMRRVVDVVHGSTAIPARPGHAAGRYDADVSRWVLAYIIGREWEPFAVKAFNTKRRGGGYAGRFLRARSAPAMDLWLVRECDLMLSYEADRYNTLRPIAYTNWPTLDPLTHPTEATTAEEAAWRKRSGRRAEANRLEYENDAVALDANLVEPTAANPAGWFASYHAYPYYPDFMILDPDYRRARSSEGPSNYFGYLRELVTHHGAMPTVIAEYGVPSSRGVAHIQHQGWNHGGHDERHMAAIDARLTREIRQAGAAGAVVFAWLDEWFKKNWAVMDYEIPPDNTRLWHNVMDAEQNYGILGQYGGDGITTPELGGNPERWRALQLVQAADETTGPGLRALRAGADESYLYLAVELQKTGINWDSSGLQLALDTYQPKTGQHRVPRTGVISELGMEFLIDLAGPGAGFIRVTPDYNRHEGIDPATGDDFGRFSRRPVITRNRKDGRFDSLFIITNRARFGRDGTFYRAMGYDRGALRYGAQAGLTLADWFLDASAGVLELRIPWDLINVTDPSTRTLLHDPRTDGRYGTTTAEDIHMGVLLYRKGRQPTVIGALPRLDGGRWRAQSFRPWRWRGWSVPRSHARLKPVYDSLKLVWAAPSGAQAQRGRKVPSN